MTFRTFVEALVGFGNTVAIPLLLALLLLLFLWGVVRYFFVKGEAESRREGGSFILWSIIGFAVVVSLWGLVSIVAGVFEGRF